MGMSWWVQAEQVYILGTVHLCIACLPWQLSMNVPVTLIFCNCRCLTIIVLLKPSACPLVWGRFAISVRRFDRRKPNSIFKCLLQNCVLSCLKMCAGIPYRMIQLFAEKYPTIEDVILGISTSLASFLVTNHGHQYELVGNLHLRG